MLFLQVSIFNIMMWRKFKQKEKKKNPLSRSFVKSRNMITQSWIDKSHYCCSLTHPNSADFLRIIWSQGQSQLNSHCDTLKYKMGAKRTYQESGDMYGFQFPETKARISYNCMNCDFLVNTLSICSNNFDPLERSFMNKFQFLSRTNGSSDITENPFYMKLVLNFNLSHGTFLEDNLTRHYQIFPFYSFFLTFTFFFLI